MDSESLLDIASRVKETAVASSVSNVAGERDARDSRDSARGCDLAVKPRLDCLGLGSTSNAAGRSCPGWFFARSTRLDVKVGGVGPRSTRASEGSTAGDWRELSKVDVVEGGRAGDFGGRGARCAPPVSMVDGFSLTTPGKGRCVVAAPGSGLPKRLSVYSSSSSHAASTSSMLRTEFATSTAVRAVGPPSLSTNF